MQDRIGFVEDSIGKKFFAVVREASSVKSWQELSAVLGLRRTQFQKYQYGHMLLPQNIFDSMIAFLPKERQEFFRARIFIKPGNWGAVKGGIKNFEKNKGNLLEHLERVRYKPVPRPVDLNQPLSAELCELIGAIIGDGCIDGHIRKNGNYAYRMSIVGDAKQDKDYLTNRISRIISELFSIPAYLLFRREINTIVLNFNSKKLFVMLTKRFGFPAGNKAFTVKIPEEIMQAGESFIFPAIRGIFDTDGCVFFDKRKKYKTAYPRITLQIVSEPLFLQLKEVLGKHFCLYAHHSSKKKSYCVEVYGHKQLAKWMNLIGFSNQRHLNKIEKSCKPWVGFEPTIST